MTLPLRLGIIGLSSNAATAWASRAHLPGLLNERGRKDFTIVALCNSSIESAKNAIQAYHLPSTVKAYGDPQSLADDKDIDVVICSVRVDMHYDTVLPSIKAGKKVFIEWPIAANRAEIDKLIVAARTSGSQVAIGVQGRSVPLIAKVREIVESGRLGKVLSSDVSAYGGTNNRDSLPPGLKYFGDRKVGGNVMTIGFGHLIDFTLSTLGDLVKGTTSARTQIQWPENKVVNPETKEVVEKFEINVPDLIIVHGQLASKSDHLAQNASMTVRFRRGQPFKGEPSLVWHINCEKGEIRLKAVGGVALQAGGYEPTPEIQIHHFADDSLEDVPWEWSGEQLEVPVPARGVMSCLYALAEGDSKGWTTLEDAAHRAEQIEAWLASGKW